jgi:transposase-like protein
MYKKKKKNMQKLFKWKHFVGEIILWLVRWYCRYALSYRDLKEIAAERGLSVERSTIMRWVHEYSPELEKRIKPHLKMSCSSTRIDETYVKIKGIWHYLYRAVDKDGQTLDWMLSVKRNKKAAKRFFRKMLGNPHVPTPTVMNVDKNPAFPPAHQELIEEGDLPSTSKLRRIKYLNNIVENDHKSVKCKSRYRQWYQSFATASATISGMETMRMIQKGQIKYLAKNDIVSQNKLINRLFGLVA